jgi:hypothetical protein
MRLIALLPVFPQVMSGAYFHVKKIDLMWFILSRI